MSGRPEPRSQIDFTLPGAPQRIPGLPQNYAPYIFEGFAGLNTKAARPAIGDQECAWVDNFMLLGPNNARTMHDIGTALYTPTPPLTVKFFGFGNIAEKSVCMVILSDGSIVEVNVATGGTVIAGGNGTILDPDIEIGMTQWGSQYILFIVPQSNRGYLIWDGTSLYFAETLGPQPILDNSGAGYVAQPTIDALGPVPGALGEFTAELTSGGAISRIYVTDPGQSYPPATTQVALVFTGGGGPSSAVAFASITGGRITNISIANGGSGYSQGTTTVAFLGGGGFGAEADVSASGAVNTITITNPGAGFLVPPVVYITDPANAVAQATVATMPYNIQGTTIETYQSRVWTGNGSAPTTPPPKNLQFFTAPGDPGNFQDGGAGSFLLTSSFVRVGVQSLKQSNGFLYLINDSSVDYLSGVTTDEVVPGSGVLITAFQIQNADPQVGTPWPKTAQVFGRSVIFANTFGVHALYGGSVKKVSDKLDGIYDSRTPTGTSPAYDGLRPSAAVAVVFGIDIYVLLLPIVDPITNQNRNALFCWDGNRWWTATQSVEFTQLATREINSVLTAYGTDGAAIYPLFQTPSAEITKIIRSKLWADPTYIVEKLSQNVQGIYQSQGNDAVSFNVSVDTEFGSKTASVTDLFEATWLTQGGIEAPWVTQGLASVTWTTTGLGVFTKKLVNAGRLIGLTLETTAPDFSLVSLMTMAQLQNIKD